MKPAYSQVRCFDLDKVCPTAKIENCLWAFGDVAERLKAAVC